MKLKITKTKIRTIRLTKFEDDLLIAEANSMGVGVSKSIRSKCGFEKIRFNQSELIEIRYFLKKISNNINQTAKALNIANLTARIEPQRYEMAFASTYNLQKLFHQVLVEFSKIKSVTL